MNTRLKGIFPALMVAFDKQDQLDCKTIGKLVTKLSDCNVNGFYVGGSSAEMVLCTLEERKQALEAVKAYAGGKTIIAHVGAMATKDAVKLAKHAGAVKADAVSSVTPLYFKYSFEEVKNYYARLCEASGLPMIIYNIPALTGSAYGFDQLAELLSIPGVAGMKFTSSDMFLMNRLKTAFPEKIIYNGVDEMLLSGLSAGADGGIGTTYNFMPEFMVAIYRLFNENRIAEAREIQSVANQVIAEAIRLGVLPASKAMIGFGGIDYGICREPFLPLSKEQENELYANAWNKIISAKELNCNIH